MRSEFLLNLFVTIFAIIQRCYSSCNVTGCALCSSLDAYSCTVCSPGYYRGGSICYPCKFGCRTCTIDLYCTSCEEDFDFDDGKCKTKIGTSTEVLYIVILILFSILIIGMIIGGILWKKQLACFKGKKVQKPTDQEVPAPQTDPQEIKTINPSNDNSTDCLNRESFKDTPDNN